MEILRGPWPWYVVGPIIGAMVPALLVIGNRVFGVSGNLRHLCAIACPARVDFFNYDWKRDGAWNLAFLAGIFSGGLLSTLAIGVPEPQIADASRAALAELGITTLTGLVPTAIISWDALTSWPGALVVIGGGFAIGFGTAWAGGCTSGHAISGLADFQLASLLAVVGFFAGGLTSTWILLPWVLS